MLCCCTAFSLAYRNLSSIDLPCIQTALYFLQDEYSREKESRGVLANSLDGLTFLRHTSPTLWARRGVSRDSNPATRLNVLHDRRIATFHEWTLLLPLTLACSIYIRKSINPSTTRRRWCGWCCCSRRRCNLLLRQICQLGVKLMPSHGASDGKRSLVLSED